MPEKPSLDASAAQLIEEAKPLERFDPGGLLPDEVVMPRQYGNNFYLFFKARCWEGDEDGNPTRSFFLRKTEEWGDVWTFFENNNRELLQNIDDVLLEEDIYNRARKLHARLIFSGDSQAADKFNAKIDPVLGLDAIGIPIWNRLNQLLEEAANAMESIGINVTELRR